ncbi:hypothetical protein [Lysobacter gummosus]|uniref:hypothetical protein n=1 Tax=Lysobacter gummosus TaxID=262324 RepID=UPI0036255678
MAAQPRCMHRGSHSSIRRAQSRQALCRILASLGSPGFVTAAWLPWQSDSAIAIVKHQEKDHVR